MEGFLKQKYSSNEQSVPLIRGWISLIWISYLVKVLMEDIQLSFVQSRALFLTTTSYLISFVYHNIQCDTHCEELIQHVDHICITFRFWAVIQSFNHSYTADCLLLISCLLYLFDKKLYIENNGCFIPYFGAFESSFKNTNHYWFILQQYLLYLIACMFYAFEYKSIFVSRYNLFRNNKYFSNHDIFHFMVFVVDVMKLQHYCYMS